MSPIKLILVNPRHPARAALRRAFAGLPNVEVAPGRIEDLPRFDCVVAAANSFGLMDGGVDASIADFFGPALVTSVQQRILDEYLGEQPVGTCLIVETGNPEHPYLAHAPTMRVPMEIAHTDNVYLAMWAMLCAVRQHNRGATRPIELVACPALGTGTGMVPYAEAARQMAVAYRHFCAPPHSIDWEMARATQEDVRYGGDLGLLIPPEGDVEE